MNSTLKLIPLGGIGDVTKNMYVYEFLPDGKNTSDIIIVDCGIGFPDVEMYGIDLVIPDITYLRRKKNKIRAILLTHGHEDHIGALPYLLPELKAPVYGTRLTAALAQAKLREFGIKDQIKVINEKTTLLKGPFTIETVHVTHSIPDAVNFIITTPVGKIYHGSDYKFDFTPVYGKASDVGKIAAAGSKKILCLLSDCVRIEKEGFTLSEKTIEQTFEREIRSCQGKFIVTTQSSNISRLQQAINVGLKHGRKIALLGRSIEQAISVAKKLKFIHLPEEALVYERQIPKYHPDNLLILAAGSQGQVGSALSRIARKKKKYMRIQKGDKVVFSSDPIPGNEAAVYTLIDELTRLGADVVYTDILEDLHVSGHGSAHDLRLMISLTNPKYLIPIGGTYRQMGRYVSLAKDMGYNHNQVLLPDNGQVVIFDRKGNVKINGHVETNLILVDGLGVGDVSHEMLQERQQMATDGMVAVIVYIASNIGEVAGEPAIISRGFIQKEKANRLTTQAKKFVKRQVKKIIQEKKGHIVDWRYAKKHLAGSLEDFFYQHTHRRPLILPILFEE